MSIPVLKDGNVLTYEVLQNTTNYQVKLTTCQKGLWMCIEEGSMIWKLTISAEMVEQTVTKATASKETMTYKQFVHHILQAVTKNSEKWSIGIMTPIQLEMLRGGNVSKQTNNNKIFLILSDKQKKYHYPFTFIMNELNEKDRLIEAIKTMKNQLQELRNQKSDKSQSSFSIMSETFMVHEQIKIQNEEMKKKIRMYEDSLTQKRGAVEIDIILKEKNTLEIKAQTKKREENKEIIRLKNIHHLLDREINQIRNQVELINRQLLLLEDSIGNSAKLKSHAMKVLRSYQAELRAQKKVLQKQGRQIETLKRNIMTSKNNERKVLGKIKQIQTEIDQAKKKANITQISNRLHSVGRGAKNSSADSSSKAPSVTSSQGKVPSQVSNKSSKSVNYVRNNMVKRSSDIVGQRNNNLMRTTPNIKVPIRKTSQQNKPNSATRNIVTSHQIGAKNTTNSKFNYNNNKNFYTQKITKKSHQDTSSVKSVEKKKQYTPQEREKQRKAMQRLTGNRQNNIPKGNSNSKEPIKTNSVRQVGKSLQGKAGINNKKENPKDILARMKEIKAQYNTQANKNSTANKNMAAKISQLTQNK